MNRLSALPAAIVVEARRAAALLTARTRSAPRQLGQCLGSGPAAPENLLSPRPEPETTTPSPPAPNITARSQGVDMLKSVEETADTLADFERRFIALCDGWSRDADNARTVKLDLEGLLMAVGEIGRGLVAESQREIATGGHDRGQGAAGTAFLQSMARMSNNFRGLDPTARRLFDAVEATPRDIAAATKAWKLRLQAALQQPDAGARR
jgi:hypothetical protein